MSDQPEQTEAADGQSELTVGLGHDGKPWPQTSDAKIWADEFCKRNSASDHGTMLGWFSNAIMLGYDMARLEAKDYEIENQRIRLIGYVPAYELSRCDSGHTAMMRSAKFGPSALDGDVPVFVVSNVKVSGDSPLFGEASVPPQGYAS